MSQSRTIASIIEHHSNRTFTPGVFPTIPSCTHHREVASDDKVAYIPCKTMPSGVERNENPLLALRSNQCMTRCNSESNREQCTMVSYQYP